MAATDRLVNWTFIDIRDRLCIGGSLSVRRRGKYSCGLTLGPNRRESEAYRISSIRRSDWLRPGSLCTQSKSCSPGALRRGDRNLVFERHFLDDACGDTFR